MQLSFKIISSPGPEDIRIHDFIAQNDNDFYPPIAARRDLTEFVQSVYDHNGKYVICYCNDEIVGLTSIYLNHPSFITYYHYVAVDKEFRHKGVATSLYNYVHDICREHGVQRAIVKTWSTNKTSQGMFNKHGFFHLDTIEDDRSPGIHTYFFAKSFSDTWFREPLKRLAVIGSNESYALGYIAKTISSIPRSNSFNYIPLPVAIISASFSLSQGSKGQDKDENIKRFNDVVADLERNGVSHLFVIDSYNYPFIDIGSINTKVEILDLAAITKGLVNARNKKCLLVAVDIRASIDFFDIENVQIPGYNDSKRISEIINEIRAGYVSPAYYKHEIATIALLNDCNCLLLGSVELHTMFGTDKRYNGVEIFDPWMETAVIIQNNRMRLRQAN